MRRTADPSFRAEQRAGTWAPHVAPVNRLVDDLRSQGRGCVPYAVLPKVTAVV